MSTLTKAFVVLVTIMSVILVALVVPFVAQTQNHAEQYSQKQTELEATRASLEGVLAEQSADHAKKVQEMTAAAEVHQETAAQLREEIKDHEEDATRIAQLTTDLAIQRAANLTMANTVEAQNALLEGQAALINESLTERAAAVARELETRVALEESLGRLTRLRNQVERLGEQLKASEVDLQEASLTIQQQKEIIEQGQLAVDDTPQPPNPIDGSITGIDEIGGGITLVEINVGSRDNVAEGMSFTVSRGDEYVGVITIQAVDTANAVGQVVRNSSDLRAGDRVAAGR